MALRISHWLAVYRPTPACAKAYNWPPNKAGIPLYPNFEYCTDNAAMIAIAGYYKYLKGEFAGQEIAPLARMPM
jgi:tRNA A37 threonylcarbamoyltransferase TsaD